MPLERVCFVSFFGRTPLKLTAMTENVGRGGALIRLEDTAPVEVGAHVAVELILNGKPSSTQKCMYCRGVVSRVLDNPFGPPRIGVRFDYVDFRNVTASVTSMERVREKAVM